MVAAFDEYGCVIEVKYCRGIWDRDKNARSLIPDPTAIQKKRKRLDSYIGKFGRIQSTDKVTYLSNNLPTRLLFPHNEAHLTLPCIQWGVQWTETRSLEGD